jgi:hypothetical protein
LAAAGLSLQACLRFAHHQFAAANRRRNAHQEGITGIQSRQYCQPNEDRNNGKP